MARVTPAKPTPDTLTFDGTKEAYKRHIKRNKERPRIPFDKALKETVTKFVGDQCKIGYGIGSLVGRTVVCLAGNVAESLVERATESLAERATESLVGHVVSDPISRIVRSSGRVVQYAWQERGKVAQVTTAMALAAIQLGTTVATTSSTDPTRITVSNQPGQETPPMETDPAPAKNSFLLTSTSAKQIEELEHYNSLKADHEFALRLQREEHSASSST